MPRRPTRWASRPARRTRSGRTPAPGCGTNWWTRLKAAGRNSGRPCRCISSSEFRPDFVRNFGPAAALGIKGPDPRGVPDMPDPQEQTIFIQALERDAGHRGAFLDEACASDPALRARVERLLHHHEHAASFLAAPAAGSPEPRADADATVEGRLREG